MLEGEPIGSRPVAIVVARFNGEHTSRMLTRALEELADAGVPESLVTVVPVPGAFELPLGALALAKTRRYACIVALGCVIRGETPHFDYVAGEAASGLQLAALETGIPVSFGVLTVETQRAGRRAHRQGRRRGARRARDGRPVRADPRERRPDGLSGYTPGRNGQGLRDLREEARLR